MRNVDLPFHMQPMWTDNPTSSWSDLDPFEVRFSCFGGDGDDAEGSDAEVDDIGDMDPNSGTTVGGNTNDGSMSGGSGDDTLTGSQQSDYVGGSIDLGNIPGYMDSAFVDFDPNVNYGTQTDGVPNPAAVGVEALAPVDLNYVSPNYTMQLDARNDQMNQNYAEAMTEAGGWFGPNYTYNPDTDTFSRENFGQKAVGFLGSQIPGFDVNVTTKGLTAGNMLDPPDEYESTIDRSFDPARAIIDVGGAFLGGNLFGSGTGSKLAGKVTSTVGQSALDAYRGQWSPEKFVSDLTGNLISTGGYKAGGSLGEKGAALLGSKVIDSLPPMQDVPNVTVTPSIGPETKVSPDQSFGSRNPQEPIEGKSGGFSFSDMLPVSVRDFIGGLNITPNNEQPLGGAGTSDDAQSRALNLSNTPVSTGGAASPIVATEIADTNVATSDAAISPQASAGALPSGVGYVLPVRDRSFGSQAYNNASPFGSRMLERRSGLGGNVIRV